VSRSAIVRLSGGVTFRLSAELSFSPAVSRWVSLYRSADVPKWDFLGARIPSEMQ
jgi:hypothetical protein